MARPYRSALEWSGVACAMVAAVLWVGPWLLRADLFYDDAAHHIFWLYRYADTDLFPGDISVEYFRTSATWGYRILYFGLARIFDAQLIAESLSILLLLASCLLVWWIGKSAAASNREAAGLLAIVALVVLLPLSQQKDVLPPIAFQRSFSLPLLLLTLWALSSGRFVWVGVSLLGAALLYPVVLPVQGLTAAVVFFTYVVTERKMPAAWVANVVLGCAALIIAAVGIPVPPKIGPAYTYLQAMQLPEFGPHGRLRMYEEGTLRYWSGGHRAGFGWPLKTLVLIAVAMLLAAVRGSLRNVPFAAWVMAAVGIGLWGAMRMFPEQLMFGLYLPNRHPKWALAAFGVFALAAGSAAVLEGTARWWRRRYPTRELSYRRGLAIGAPFFVAAVLLPNAIQAWNRPVDKGLEDAYAFIGRLPKETLVAAHPDLGDFVPMRTRRSVLTSTEISMAWMKGYYAVMKPRVQASLRAAYATRIEDVDAALQPYGVDVMLSGPSVWEKTGYLAPFDGEVQYLLERGRREGFVLRHPPADRVLFQSGEYYVVRVGACPQDACP